MLLLVRKDTCKTDLRGFSVISDMLSIHKIIVLVILCTWNGYSTETCVFSTQMILKVQIDSVFLKVPRQSGLYLFYTYPSSAQCYLIKIKPTVHDFLHSLC